MVGVQYSRLKRFWSQVHEKIQEIIGKEVPRIPRVMLLCDFSGRNIGTSGSLLANMLTAAAVVLIASKWKMAEIPTISECSKIRDTALMGKLTAICDYRRGQLNASVNFHKQREVFFPSRYVSYQRINVRDSVLTML